MSILSENSKKMLVEAMRECLSDVLHESTSLTSKQATEKIKFVNESATYEQLLNVTMNPLRESNYLPVHTLEGAVAILSEAMYTGRKVIGINAITEGAKNLVKKTGCKITESMLDAAMNAASGKGLKVISEAIMMIQESAKTDSKAFFQYHELNKKLEKAIARKDAGAIASLQGQLNAIKASIGKPDDVLRAKKLAKSTAEGAAKLAQEKQGLYQKALAAANGNKTNPNVIAARTEFVNAKNALKAANDKLIQANAHYNRVLKFYDLSRETVTKNGKTVGKWVKGYSGGVGGSAPASKLNGPDTAGTFSKLGNHLSKHAGKYALGAAAAGAGYLGIKKWLDKKRKQQEYLDNGGGEEAQSDSNPF